MILIKRTISIAKGKGSINHNSREFKAENVDANRTEFNTCFINEKLEDVYHKLFDEALLKYNAKQKRNDRKIPNYMEHIRLSKDKKVFYEIIAQVGDFENMNATTDNGKLAEEILKKYMADFQKRNPTLYVFSAYLHMDEATPHLHIDFVPYTDGNKRGLETQNSLKQALKKLGFEGGSRSDTELNQWQNSEKEKLAEIMLQYEIEWEKKGTHKESLPVLDYKKEMRTKEVEELEKVIETKQLKVTDLDNKLNEKKVDFTEINQKKIKLKKLDDVEVKDSLIRNRVTLNKSEFEDIKFLAQKQIVSEQKEKKLKTEVKCLRSELSSLKQENEKQKDELFQYKSLKNKLNMGKIIAENEQLKKFQDMVMKFLEVFNLKEQFNKFMNKNEVNLDEKTYL
ncbi:MAG: plasmid recombination protein [Anaerovoracaceae bacterium]